jgi:hypothetical protein
MKWPGIKSFCQALEGPISPQKCSGPQLARSFVARQSLEFVTFGCEERVNCVEISKSSKDAILTSYCICPVLNPGAFL